MRSFGELLSEYTQRTGVSDAELARHLGVRRQTIFRWKEGLTRRPRERQDVLKLADKLRLAPEERDELLLAAGFVPEGEIERDSLDDNAEQLEEHVDIDKANHGLSRRIQPWILALLLIVMALVLLALAQPATWWQQAFMRLGFLSATPTLQVTQIDAAGPDETLILVGEFANYGGEAIGFNVAGRLQEALRTELATAGLEQVRVETVAEVITGRTQAIELGQSLNATLVVWGEYDSGRVLAYISVPSTTSEAREVMRVINTPAELNATINIDLPDELKWITLLVLGQAHYLAERPAIAEAAFQQALSNPPIDSASRATVNFYLGLIESGKQPVDWNQTIAYYDEAIDLNPGLVSALNNRGVAYLQRQSPGDLVAAESDLREVTNLSPELSAGFLNLGLTLARLYPDDRLDALQNLQAAYDLAPDSASINNALCWNYSLAGQPAKALPYCQQAVSSDLSGYSHDSRALAYALLGRYDKAAADLEFFLTHLQEQDPGAYAMFQASRTAWMDTLREGKNPFDESTLYELRRE